MVSLPSERTGIDCIGLLWWLHAAHLVPFSPAEKCAPFLLRRPCVGMIIFPQLYLAFTESSAVIDPQDLGGYCVFVHNSVGAEI